MARRRRYLHDVDAEKEFFVADGRVVRNLLEMADALMSMDNDTFSAHVNEDKNDFRNWVKDVVGEASLAEKMGSSRDKNELAAVTLRTIVDRK